MSVINKMLRDLDARRAEGALPDLTRQARSAAMQGTVSVGERERTRTLRLRWLLAMALLAVAAAAVWYGQGAETQAPMAVVPPKTVEPAAAAPQAAASDAVADAASPVLEPSLPAAAPQASPAAAPTPPKDSPPPARPTAADKVAAARERAPAPRTTPPATSARARTERTVTMAAASVPAAASPVSTAPASPAAPTPRPQTALQETLAQAQNLWTAGSREAAIDLLREAVTVAERAPATENDPQALAALMRELTRMELAQGRSAAALDLLVRLESRLSGQADLWAVRGNAAQRLGRHAESVQAYQRALQLRPGEQRWLLGTAVSLAALGQLEAAAQQAEQARALGPVSPEVLTYLRQAGVPLR